MQLSDPSAELRDRAHVISNAVTMMPLKQGKILAPLATHMKTSKFFC